jgi:hypothetical protein
MFGTWIYSLSLQPQQTTISWNNFLKSFQLALTVSLYSAGTNCTDSSSWSNRTARLARLLNLNTNCPSTLELLLNRSWTAFPTCSASLCSDLWTPRSGLNCSPVDRKEITDRPCWSVTVDSWPCERQSAKILVSAVAGYRAVICVCAYFETDNLSCFFAIACCRVAPWGSLLGRLGVHWGAHCTESCNDVFLL